MSSTSGEPDVVPGEIEAMPLAEAQVFQRVLLLELNQAGLPRSLSKLALDRGPPLLSFPEMSQVLLPKYYALRAASWVGDHQNCISEPEF